MAFDPVAAAREIARQHRERVTFSNLEGDLAPPTIEDGYAAQEALRTLWEPQKGPVVGRKIATTTKVMQELMGIDHPCGGLIYESTVHRTGSTLSLADFMHMVLECELAVQLGADLPDIGRDYTRDEVRGAVSSVMAAFELIEDRNAVYKSSDARTLLADNAWNGGIVLGNDIAVAPEFELNGLRAAATLNGKPHGEGLSDDPMGALAWVANLAVKRGQAMTKGMVVITGSVIQTFTLEPGDQVHFEFDNVGFVDLTVTA